MKVLNIPDLKIFAVKYETQKALHSFQDGGDGVIEARRLEGILSASKKLGLEQVFMQGGLAAYTSLPDPLPQLVITNPDFDADVFPV